MDCSHAREFISGYVVDTLEEHERLALQEHLRNGCMPCQSELDHQVAAATLLAESLEPMTPPLELKQQLLNRLDTEPQALAPETQAVSLPPTAQSPSRSPATRYLPYVAATVAAIGAGALLGSFWRFEGSPEIAQQSSQDATAEWQRNVEAAEQAFGLPRAQLIGFDGTIDNQQFQASIFYDKLAGQLHILVSKLPESPPGKTLWFWLLDEQGKVLTGGPLSIHSLGRATSITSSPSLPSDVSEALITAETETDLDQPAGPVMVRAQLKPTL